MEEAEAGALSWRRSSFCSESACLEVATQGRLVYLRAGKDQDGPVLSLTRTEWEAFLAGARQGEFDLQ
jgi:hypothetical protein